ncbi:MAG: hypothetical protein H8M99_15975 [Gloeobacteraceae cyanobacterium ES-bin-144]|nr:hypothetical protein [Verrucomicrobiales bacterium]
MLRIQPSVYTSVLRNQADDVSIFLLARPVLGHTVKELPSRGLKSRSGGFTEFLNSANHLDRHPVSRPPSVVAAREATCHSHNTSTHFDSFFAFFSKHSPKPLQYSDFFVISVLIFQKMGGFFDSDF